MTRTRGNGGGPRSPTDIDRAVGVNLRRLRHQRGQTLSELAVLLGISHQQLQKYESGANRLSAGMLCRAAEVLTVPVERLFQISEGGDVKKKSAQAEALDELRQEGAYYLGRAGSQKALTQMVQVLKVLSASS